MCVWRRGANVCVCLYACCVQRKYINMLLPFAQKCAKNQRETKEAKFELNSLKGWNENKNENKNGRINAQLKRKLNKNKANNNRETDRQSQWESERERNTKWAETSVYILQKKTPNKFAHGICQMYRTVHGQCATGAGKMEAKIKKNYIRRVCVCTGCTVLCRPAKGQDEQGRRSTLATHALASAAIAANRRERERETCTALNKPSKAEGKSASIERCSSKGCAWEWHSPQQPLSKLLLLHQAALLWRHPSDNSLVRVQWKRAKDKPELQPNWASTCSLRFVSLLNLWGSCIHSRATSCDFLRFLSSLKFVKSMIRLNNFVFMGVLCLNSAFYLFYSPEELVTYKTL